MHSNINTAIIFVLASYNGNCEIIIKFAEHVLRYCYAKVERIEKKQELYRE